MDVASGQVDCQLAWPGEQFEIFGESIKKKIFIQTCCNFGITGPGGHVDVMSYTLVKLDIHITVSDPFYLFETIRNIDCHIALLFSTKKRTEAKENDVFPQGS